MGSLDSMHERPVFGSNCSRRVKKSPSVCDAFREAHSLGMLEISVLSVNRSTGSYPSGKSKCFRGHCFFGRSTTDWATNSYRACPSSMVHCNGIHAVGQPHGAVPNCSDSTAHPVDRRVMIPVIPATSRVPPRPDKINGCALGHGSSNSTAWPRK